MRLHRQLDFRQQQALILDLCVDIFVLRGIDHIHAAGHDAGGCLGQAAFVTGSIDAARQAGNHQVAGVAEILGKAVRQLAAIEGGVARADHGDGGTGQQVRVAQGRQ